MDLILTPLINAGGTGLVAALLFVLFRDALKTFREELRAERESNAANLTSLRESSEAGGAETRQEIRDLTQSIRDLIARACPQGPGCPLGQSPNRRVGP